MGKSTGSEAELCEYVCAKIESFAREQKMSMAKLAGIGGYERGALYRVIRKKQLPKMSFFFLLQDRLGVPISYWFPNQPGINTQVVTLRANPNCVCADTAPLTRENVRAIGKLSAVEKMELLKLLTGEDDRLADFLTLAELVSPLTSEERSTIIRGVGNFIRVHERPASK